MAFLQLVLMAAVVVAEDAETFWTVVEWLELLLL